MTWQERVLKINKVIWTTKLRVIHTQISIPKQYQMTMSSVARIKFIKTKVIFMYHTKDVSNQVHYNSDHEIKSYSCSNSTTKMSKKKKKKKIQIRAGISNRGKEISNLGRDYKSGQGGFKMGQGKILTRLCLKFETSAHEQIVIVHCWMLIGKLLAWYATETYIGDDLW